MSPAERVPPRASGADLVERQPVHLFDAVVLSLLLRSPRARDILSAVDSAASGCTDQRRVPAPDILAARVRERRPALGARLVQAERRAERALRQTDAARMETVVYGDFEYPSRLADIIDPPPVLWLRGSRERLGCLGVALVGSRAGSRYACTVAEQLGAQLSARGVTTVSGLARGVDGAAHRGGLCGPGGTIAVLGCGVDVDYPAEHAGLAREIASHGVVVSEFGPSAPPLRSHFPRRNRIISGLSAAVVVVEASDRSGSLITARVATEQGREVMAVPGSVLTGRNRGGHALLRDGAKVVETADDILEELPDMREATRDQWKLAALDPLGMDPATVSPGDEIARVLGAMELAESYDLDTLVTKTGLSGPSVLAQLTDLELAGRIERSRTGHYCRVRG